MERIANLSAIEALEQINPNLPDNTYQVFLQSAKLHSHKIALRFLLSGDVEKTTVLFTYQNLLKKVTQTANALHHLGVNNNDVVSLLLPNLPQTHFAIWGAQATGIVNPINPLLEAEQIISIMNAAQSKVLVTLSPSSNEALWEKISVISKNVPSLETILVIDLARLTSTNINSLKNPGIDKTILDFDLFIAEQNSEQLTNTYEVQANDIACYLHTGGTTGAPKLAMLSHSNLMHSAYAMRAMLFEPDDILFACLPLFHVFAVVACGLAPFILGAEVLLVSPQGFRDETVIKNMWQLLSSYNVSVFLAVPTIFNVLSTIPTQEFNLSKVKYSISGSAPLPIQTIKNFEKHTGIKVHEGYGMTESACIISVNPRHAERKIGSVGLRIPFQEMKAAITDEDNHYLRDCETDEVGHIMVKGPNIFKGYKNLILESFTDGWFDTGDLGYQDKQGCFWIRGRSKDLIIRGGHNIDPQIIEEALYQHPAVLTAAAIGKPDKKLGELPVAYVSLHPNQSVDEKELLEFISDKIVERAATPKNIYILESMPVTEVGKIFKPQLRLDAIKRTLSDDFLPLKDKGIHIDISVTLQKQHGQHVKVNIINHKNDTQLTHEIYDILKDYNLQTEVVYS